ncbi:MAG TPA: DNA ligase D [Candidatus Limnocylindrales bacterium]|nr:DNA ligase D [Candidatus Limnocylindrales bacterium]
MSLERYRRKRDFTKTPEPSGEGRGRTRRRPTKRATGPAGRAVRPPSGDRRFVVQRHRATRLHYDFRLEIDGVLVSWAIPKGPSLDPGQRRMAVHVEDHPLDYFDFEGVIPKGEYGGGDVVVWDWGTWEPEETDDPARAVRDGELKFRLNGEKLGGRFTLVRTRPGALEGSDKENWLLIKKRDEAADPDWDIDDHPHSVKTGRTNDQVAVGADVLWDSSAPADQAAIDLSGAVEAPMPDFVPPMKATLTDRPFSDPDWLFELKWDGYRVEAVVSEGRLRLWTRNQQDAGRYFPDLTGPPAWIRAREAIVDGEVVAFDRDGRPDFSLLQDRTGIRAGEHGRTEPGRPPKEAAAAEIPLAYEVFDLLYLDGRSLLDVPLEGRKRLLRSVLRDHDLVRYASHIEADGEAFHDVARQRGLEGIVAKLRQGHYEPGKRSRSWLKIKIRREQELVVAGYVPGKGSHKDLGSLILGVHEDGRFVFAGEVGSGIDTKTRAELVKSLDSIRRDDPPFDEPVRIKDARWTEPRLVVRVEFSEWTTDGLLRQGAYKGLEVGRDPASVTRERAVATAAAVKSAERAAASARRRGESDPPGAEPEKKPRRAGRSAPRARRSGPPDRTTQAELEALDTMKKDGTWEIGGERLALTNLDKELFPPREGTKEPPITKRELIRYFVTISPVILPYLAERPLNLHRYPNGAFGSGFWQKDLPDHTPSWLRRWTETDVDTEERKANTHLIADRVATMAWLANSAAFEIHPWTARLEALDRPTYAYVDIDPGDRSTFEGVLTVARLYRTALEHLGLRAYPKTTGRRGIQVWIPIRPRYSFAETSAWVEQLSRAVGQLVPELVSWEWTVSARRGRIRLDYTQNAQIKTLVAPYAVRPAAGAPVSAPIGWAELDDPDLRSDRWTIRDVPDRVERAGDPFRGALEYDQELPPLD